MAVKVKFHLSDISTYYSDGFRSIDISRSSDNGVTYYLISHSCCADSPRLPGTIGEPWDLDGKQLIVNVSGVTWTVLFTGISSWDFARADGWLRAHAPLSLYSIGGGKVGITSNSTGSSSYISVQQCSAADIFGFTPMIQVYGTDSAIAIYSNVIDYEFVDGSGILGDVYRYRLMTDGGEYSHWSHDSIAGPGYIVPEASVCKGYVDLVDSGGNPLVSTRIIVDNYWAVQDVSSSSDKAVSFRREAVTNVDGHAELYLIKGQTLDLAISGMSIVRRIVIPDVSSVNLLDPLISLEPDIISASTYVISAALPHS